LYFFLSVRKRSLDFSDAFSLSCFGEFLPKPFRLGFQKINTLLQRHFLAIERRDRGEGLSTRFPLHQVLLREAGADFGHLPHWAIWSQCHSPFPYSAATSKVGLSV